MKYVIFTFVLCLASVPSLVNAQAGGLVTCEGPDCNWCTLVSMINGLVTWLIAFLSIIAVTVMVIAGFKMVTSGGNTAAWESGKTMFTNVVIGIIIVLAAWLIVDTVLQTLTKKGGISEWFPSDCGGITTPSIDDDDEEPITTGDEAEVREQLRSMGYTVNKASCGGRDYRDVPGGCTSVGNFTHGMMNSLSSVSDGCTGCNLVITGGSEAGHQTHDDGNSVDLRFDAGLNSYVNSGGTTRSGLRCVAESDHWHCRR